MTALLSAGALMVLACLLFGFCAWFIHTIREANFPAISKFLLLPVGLLGFYLASLVLASVLGVFLFVSACEFFQSLNS